MPSCNMQDDNPTIHHSLFPSIRIRRICDFARGAASIGPAVANAVYAATNKRIPLLPFATTWRRAGRSSNQRAVTGGRPWGGGLKVPGPFLCVYGGGWRLDTPWVSRERIT